jgi:hypothetical protein
MLYSPIHSSDRYLRIVYSLSLSSVAIKLYFRCKYSVGIDLILIDEILAIVQTRRCRSAYRAHDTTANYRDWYCSTPCQDRGKLKRYSCMSFSVDARC